MDKNDLIQEFEKNKIMVIIRGVEKDKILPLANALYDGGIRFVEITYPQYSDLKIVCEEIKMISDNFSGKLHVGAGTVLTKKQVRLTKKAGGEFVISPDTFSDVIKVSKRLNLISIPGAFTPTEIAKASRLGADFVKLFPISNIDNSYIKSISAPLSNVRFLAFGGITLENIDSYDNNIIKGFGIGSNLVNKKLIEENKFNEITKLARQYVDKVKQY